MRYILPLLLLAGATPSPTPAPKAPHPVLLIGQSWLGLWRDGRVRTMRALPQWVLGASRLDADGRTVAIAVHRAGATEDGDTVLLFDARTLAPRGQRRDLALAGQDVRVPIGVDPDVADDRAALGQGPARVHPATGQRVVLSPDSGVVATFAPAAAGRPWPGTARIVASGRVLPARALFIDNGTRRENGAARALACLLPGGEGAIFTYLGQPADRTSEFQAFAGAARPVVLTTPYVMSCLAPR